MMIMAKLKYHLQEILSDEVISILKELLSELQKTNHLERHAFWVKKRGEDCRYAKLSRKFFEEDHAERIAKVINYLHDHWSYKYKEED